MALNLVKTHTPDVTPYVYNRDIGTLFETFTGIENQELTLGGLTVTPLANSTSALKITDASENAIFTVDVTNGDIIIPATGKVLLDGGTHTYIYEKSADVFALVVGGTETLQSSTSQITAQAGIDLAIQAATKLYLDGGSNTYILEAFADEIDFYLGGNQAFIMRTTDYYAPGDGAYNLGVNTGNDWNTIYYHTLSQHSSALNKIDIEPVPDDTLKPERLPKPKTFKRDTTPDKEEYGLIAEDCPDELIALDDNNVAMIQTDAFIAYLSGVMNLQGIDVAALKDKDQVLEDTILNLQNKDTELESFIVDNQSDISQIQNDIVALQAKDEDHENRIVLLENKVIELETRIEKLEKPITPV